MSGDFNQRPAYGWPTHHRSRCHNVVEVDEKDRRGHAWVRNLFDAPGSPYLSAESVAPHGMENVKLFCRQCALVNVDKGKTGNGVRDAGVTMPSLYAFDVFRVSGGKVHTYCSHGCVDDGFTANVENKQPPTRDGNSPDGGYLNEFRWWAKGDPKAAGIGAYPATEHTYWVAECAGEDLVADWQLSRKAEEVMLRGSAETASRKHTRLTLLDQKDSKIIHAHARAAGSNGQYGRCLYAQKRSGEDMASVLVALIEPYEGEPTVVSHRKLKIADNEDDALKAVAIEVKTKNGHTDVLFADGRPGKTRAVGGDIRVAAEYAYISRDAEGLRQAAVTGGALLSTPDIAIEIETPRYEGTV
jgi:hypothetical protein